MSPDPLRQLLRDLRAGRLAQDVAPIDDAAAQAALKRTTYLKLRHGDPVPAFLEYLPACAICTQVHPPGDFADYRDFQQCDTRLNEARAAGALLRIGEPVWYKGKSACWEAKLSLPASGAKRCGRLPCPSGRSEAAGTGRAERHRAGLSANAQLRPFAGSLIPPPEGEGDRRSRWRGILRGR